MVTVLRSYRCIPSQFLLKPLVLPRLLRLSSQTADNTVLGASTIFPHTTFMNGGYYKVCYSPDGSMTGNEFLNAIVPVDIRVIGVASPCLGNGCLAEERWDCYVSYFGEDTSNCLIDFRAFGGGREGWTVEAGTASKSAWTAAWDRDTFLFGEYIPAPRVRCSDVVTAEYIAPETAVFTDFAWAPPTGMGFITDAFTSLEMPRLRRQSAVDSLTMSVCYCPSYDGPVDPTNDPCDHAAWHLDVQALQNRCAMNLLEILRPANSSNQSACSITGSCEFAA